MTGRPLQDISGQSFGCLDVVERDTSKIYTSTGGRAKVSYWKVKCKNCGMESVTSKSHIKRLPKSCVHCKFVYTKAPTVTKNCVMCGDEMQVATNYAAKTKVCNHCHKEYQYKKRRDKRKKDIIGTLKELVYGIKSRSKKKGYECDIDFDYVFDLYNQKDGNCWRTGVKLLPANGSSRRILGHPHTASIDRVNPNQGYVKGNIEMVTYICNVAKNAFTHDELLSFCEAYIKQASNSGEAKEGSGQ